MAPSGILVVKDKQQKPGSKPELENKRTTIT